MSRRLFIGNLSWQTKWWNLKDYMKTIGEVTYVDIYRDRDGRSKGCGIVEFEKAEDAQRAIAELNDTELDGRKLFIKLDEQQPTQETKPKVPSTPATAGKRVFVGNLSFETTADELKQEFASIGSVVSAEIAMSGQRSRGWGLVEFATEEAAQRAIAQCNGKVFNGRPMNVRLDQK